jgi:hypothetical protein
VPGTKPAQRCDTPGQPAHEYQRRGTRSHPHRKKTKRSNAA